MFHSYSIHPKPSFRILPQPAKLSHTFQQYFLDDFSFEFYFSTKMKKQNLLQLPEHFFVLGTDTFTEYMPITVDNGTTSIIAAGFYSKNNISG